MPTLLLALALLTVQAEPACDKCGTRVHATAVKWTGSPSEAAKKAKAEEKLVFVVHVSGHGLNLNGPFGNAALGAYLDKHYVSSFQKLPFPVDARERRAGSMVSTFCAPDGRVLHAVAGVTDAATLLREAAWTVESATKAIEESRTKEIPFKAVFRRLHAERLRRDWGLVVEPVTFDAVESAEDDPLTWRDPSGRPIAPPPLLPPPIDGPDVQFRAMAKEARDGIPDRKGCRWGIGLQGRVHQLMAAHALVKIERLYPTLFSIAGEQVRPGSCRTVLPREPERVRICLGCEGE